VDVGGSRRVMHLTSLPAKRSSPTDFDAYPGFEATRRWA
jgi:hypothetical protein